MRKKMLGLVFGALIVGSVVVPAGVALAETGPCGEAPGPHCRPACFYEVIVHEGDPANGEAPWVEVQKTFC